MEKLEQQQQNSTKTVGEVLSSSEFIKEAKELTKAPLKYEYKYTCRECKEEKTISTDRSYLEWQLPKFCPTCAKIRQEKEINSQRIKRWTEICPPLYLESDRNLLPDESARIAYDKIQDYIFTEKGLVVHGLTRRGKTRAVWQRMKKGFMATGLEPKFSFGGMFSLNISESFEQHETTALVKSFGTAPIVFFDDIGQMIFTERVQECLFTILEMRCAYLRPTVFTMNDIGDTLKAKFSGNRGEAFVSRLKEFCEIIKF